MKWESIADPRLGVWRGGVVVVVVEVLDWFHLNLPHKNAVWRYLDWLRLVQHPGIDIIVVCQLKFEIFEIGWTLVAKCQACVWRSITKLSLQKVFGLIFLGVNFCIIHIVPVHVELEAHIGPLLWALPLLPPNWIGPSRLLLCGDPSL